MSNMLPDFIKQVDKACAYNKPTLFQTMLLKLRISFPFKRKKKPKIKDQIEQCIREIDELKEELVDLEYRMADLVSYYYQYLCQHVDDTIYHLKSEMGKQNH